VSQAQVLERLYYVDSLSIAELSVILNISTRSVENNIYRLRKIKYIERTEKGRYQLTSKGKDFAERFYI
jgi:Mn-dependent DtxR family transcriptional regulator